LILFLDWSPSYCENRTAYNTRANPAAPKIPAIGAAVLMAPALLVPELPAPPVEEAPVWLPVEEDPVAEEEWLPVEEDPVAEEEWLPVEEDASELPVEEDASELPVDEAALLEEAPVSWAEEPPPVTPLRALLTSPPAADVTPPTMLGGVRILFLCEVDRGVRTYSTRFSGCWRPGVAMARPLRRATAKYWNCILK
jgi:hypothetical protein